LLGVKKIPHETYKVNERNQTFSSWKITMLDKYF